MLDADPALVAALEAPDRVTTTLTRLGGREVTDQITAWALDRAYDTDLPAPIRATNGSAAAELRLTLSGDGTDTAARLYGPYAPHTTGDLARPGQSVIHGWGVADDALPAFRGGIRDRSADAVTGLVELTALDGAERLRDAARLPATLSTTGGPIASGTWIVDHLARRAGIFTCPPPRPGCVLDVTMHGGIVPSTGFYREHAQTPISYRFTDDVPWQCALEAYSTPYVLRYDPRTRTTIGGRSLLVEAWVQQSGGGSAGNQLRLSLHYATDSVAETLYLLVDLTANTITVGTAGSSTSSKGYSGVGLTTRGTYHVGVHWSWTGKTPSARIYATGPGIRGGYLEAWLGDLVPLADAQLSHVEITGGAPVEAVQVCTTITTPAGRGEFEPAWTRGGVVTGLTSQLNAIPPTQGSAWEIISAVAQAEQATCEFDPHGLLRYRPNSRFRAPGQPALTVTSAREIAALRVSEAIDSVRNVIDVTYQSIEHDGDVEVFSDTGTRSIPAGQSLTLTFDYGTSEYDCAPPRLFAATTPFTSSRVRFSPSASGTTGLFGGIETTTDRDGNQLVITFRNATGGTVYMITTGGTNSLAIRAPRAYQDSTTGTRTVRRTDTTSQQRYGAQTYQVTATPWIQRWDTAATLANHLLGMAARPLPVLGEVEILPDPRLTLGDLVRVVDQTGAALDTPAWVVGISTSGDNTGQVRQTLTLRATSSPTPPEDVGLFPDPPTDPDAHAVLAAEGVRVP
ncbi:MULTISPECIES: hypothetical protein [Actinosynnema]|uniref:hypothetical protein n=1 Tax=Actinosynnema TaxID=40566 RepID=UPI0020A32E0E|nr:hypothetical protein [Actinosynnema pretiosum]MCP2092655.1 hypothetical protein [Actinosynnema pretiosum]